MRMPACPVAPATNTVLGSLRRELPNDKPEDGLLAIGIKDFTSPTLPKLNLKGLELVPFLSSASASSEDELELPSPNENGPSLLAMTLSLGVFRFSLEFGVEVRRTECEVRVAAIDGG